MAQVVSTSSQTSQVSQNVQLKQHISNFKIRLVLFVTKLIAIFGLYMTKLFEFIFRLILILPDRCFSLTNKYHELLYKNLQTSTGECIEILRAQNNSGDITNKFKLFLRWYWTEKTGRSINDTNGFNFDDYVKLFRSTMLYCSYLVEQGKNTTTASTSNNVKKIIGIVKNQILEDAKRFMISVDKNGDAYKYVIENHNTTDANNNIQQGKELKPDTMQDELPKGIPLQAKHVSFEESLLAEQTTEELCDLDLINSLE